VEGEIVDIPKRVVWCSISLSWGGRTAAPTIITLPVLLLAFLVQTHIVRGVPLGALEDNACASRIG